MGKPKIFSSHGRYHNNSVHIQNTSNPETMSSNGIYEDNALHIQGTNVNISQNPNKKIKKRNKRRLVIEQCDNCSIQLLKFHISQQSPKIVVNDIVCHKITKLNSFGGIVASVQMEYQHNNNNYNLYYKCSPDKSNISLVCNYKNVNLNIFKKNQYSWEEFKNIISKSEDEVQTNKNNLHSLDVIQLKFGDDKNLEIVNVKIEAEVQVERMDDSIIFNYSYKGVKFNIINKCVVEFRSQRYALLNMARNNIDKILFREHEYDWNDFAKIIYEACRYPALADEIKMGLLCQKCYDRIDSQNSARIPRYCKNCLPI